MEPALKQVPTSKVCVDRIRPVTKESWESSRGDTGEEELLSHGGTEAKGKSKPGVKQEPEKKLRGRGSRRTNIETRGSEMVTKLDMRYSEMSAVMYCA